MKRNYLHRLIVFIVSLSILIAAVGCGSRSEEKVNSTNSDSVTIRVGYFPNLTHAQALVGFSDGTFQKALGEKVKIEERNFNAGPAEIEALLAGEIDLGYIGPVPAVNGYVKSKGGLKIIAGAANAGAVLVAGKGTGIKTAADLNGKKVAVPQLGNTQDISLRNLLTELKLKDAAKGGTVTVIPADNPNILALIGKGDVDAALVPEPWGSRIVEQAGASVILDANQVWRGGKYSTAVVIVSTKFLNEHPDLVERWIQAHVEITDRINGNKEASKKILNSQIKRLTKKSLADNILDTAFNRIEVTYNPESESVRDFVSIAIDNGYIKGSPDISNLFDQTILNKVLEKKGRKTIE